MRWFALVGCLLAAACGGGGSEGSTTTSTTSRTSTTSTTSTTEPPPAEKGTLDGLEISSGLSAFFARHLDTTYVVDAGRIGARFEPTLRAFADDGTMRTYGLPIDDPLLYVIPLWADGGLTILGIECPGWAEGEVPDIDLNEPGEIRRICGSADLVLRRWTSAGWDDPRPVFDAPSGFGFHSALGAQAIVARLPGNAQTEGSDDEPVVVDLLTGETDELPQVPDGTQDVCLQSDGPVAIVDPEEDGAAGGGERPRWSAHRLEGDAWGSPVELPDGYVAGCLANGGFLVSTGTSGVWVEVARGGTLRTQDLGKPSPAHVQFRTTLGTLAEGDGRLFVFSAGEWVDAGPEPDAFFLPVGAKVLIQPRGETVDEDGTIVRLTPVTLRLQG